MTAVIEDSKMGAVGQVSPYETLAQFVEVFDVLTGLIDRQNLSVNYNISHGEACSDNIIDRVQKSVYHLSSTSTPPSGDISQLTDRINLSNSEIRDILLSLLTGKCGPVLREMLERGAFTLKSIKVGMGAGKELTRYTAQELERTGFLCRQSLVRRTSGPNTAIFGFIGVPPDTVARAKAKHLQLFTEEKRIIRTQAEAVKSRTILERIIKDIHGDPERDIYKGVHYVSIYEIEKRIKDSFGYPKPDYTEIIAALELDPGWRSGSASAVKRAEGIAEFGEEEYLIRQAIEPWRKAYLKTGVDIPLERIQQIHPKWNKETVLRVFNAVHAPEEKSVNAGRNLS